MHNTGVSARTAHLEWASRPPDERFTSVSTLYEAARVRRERTEERIIHTDQFNTDAEGIRDLVLREPSGHTAVFTHWSFEQLAALVGAPSKYLRALPAPIVSSAINYGLRQQGRYVHQLYADRTAPWTIHAITSRRYARVHYDELAARVLDLTDHHPAWHLPLGYKDGVFGAEMVPSGAYMGDRDMFVFIVDGNRSLDDPTDRSHAGVFRGFFLRNSDVGAAALTLDLFLFRAVCRNHLIWGFQHVAGLRRRHLGASTQGAWTDSIDAVSAALDASPASDHTMLLRATTQELGSTRDEVIETVSARFDLPRIQASDAYSVAEANEPNPRSVWGYVQGLTRLSQYTHWQDARFALDRTAGRLLATVT
ncbi:MAG: hypothetical protein ACRD2X_25135 [Vicinamibacteraceae bacterium]